MSPSHLQRLPSPARLFAISHGSSVRASIKSILQFQGHLSCVMENFLKSHHFCKLRKLHQSPVTRCLCLFRRYTWVLIRTCLGSYSHVSGFSYSEGLLSCCSRRRENLDFFRHHAMLPALPRFRFLRACAPTAVRSLLRCCLFSVGSVTVAFKSPADFLSKGVDSSSSNIGCRGETCQPLALISSPPLQPPPPPPVHESNSSCETPPHILPHPTSTLTPLTLSQPQPLPPPSLPHPYLAPLAQNRLPPPPPPPPPRA